MHRFIIKLSPVVVGSPSPDRHISFVAMEKMVTGFLPSTCLMTGSCPTRPRSCTLLIAVRSGSKDKNIVFLAKRTKAKWFKYTKILSFYTQKNIGYQVKQFFIKVLFDC